MFSSEKMLRKIIGKIWRVAPRSFRVGAVRLTQTKFTASVGAVIVNEKGEILLLNHVLRPGSGWGIPGGFINAGEQPEEAIAREILEEINLKISDVRLFHTRVINRHLELFFAAAADGSGEVQSLEIKQIGWFKISDLPAGMADHQRADVRNLLNKSGLIKEAKTFE